MEDLEHEDRSLHFLPHSIDVNYVQMISGDIHSVAGAASLEESSCGSRLSFQLYALKDPAELPIE